MAKCGKASPRIPHLVTKNAVAALREVVGHPANAALLIGPQTAAVEESGHFEGLPVFQPNLQAAALEFLGVVGFNPIVNHNLRWQEVKREVWRLRSESPGRKFPL